MMQVALTIDLHAGDRPEHIDRCNDWLRAREIPATFQVPTAMLEQESFGGPIAPAVGHGGGFGFFARFAGGLRCFFSRPPRSFRSPTWCWINRCVMA